MFSTAVIIFREVFEIVLIVGIVLAATRSMPRRGIWIQLGFALGIGGAMTVAYFVDSISEMAEGTGQEIFNASVLFIAAAFIGWTVLWMQRHARQMRAQFMALGESIRRGDAPCYSLTIVIALAMWREGSEIVLFMYGKLASGEAISSMAMGGLMGAAAGLAVGLMVYFGLIKLSMRYFFMVTSWLLVALVAGMISQGIGFLISVGYFETMSATVWDSSGWIDESGVVGQFLHALVGYTSQPAQAQIGAYVLTLVALGVGMRLAGGKKTPASLPNAA